MLRKILNKRSKITLIKIMFSILILLAINNDFSICIFNEYSRIKAKINHLFVIFYALNAFILLTFILVWV